MQPQQRFNEESSDVGKLGLSESYGPAARKRAGRQLVLIVSEAAMPTRANSELGDADRLSGLASYRDDATVGSCGKLNRKNTAEMTVSVEPSTSNKNVQVLRFNGSSLTVDMYIPSGTVYGLNTNYIDLYVTTERKYQFGQLKALLGSDPLENGGEFGGRCDANPEPSIALTRAKARVETMGRPLPEEDEDIVRSTGKLNRWYVPFTGWKEALKGILGLFRSLEPIWRAAYAA